MIIRTGRLILRPWQEEDLEPFAQIKKMTLTSSLKGID